MRQKTWVFARAGLKFPLRQGLYSSSYYYYADKMANVYVTKDNYNQIILLEKEPSKFVNDAVKEKLEREKKNAD